LGPSNETSATQQPHRHIAMAVPMAMAMAMASCCKQHKMLHKLKLNTIIGDTYSYADWKNSAAFPLAN